MECWRLDHFDAIATQHKALFTLLISSDLMIADISTRTTNVLYELGVRHAMRRGGTLLIAARGRLRGYLYDAQVLLYEPDESGRLTGTSAGRFREDLKAAIRTTIHDSPIYEFFPDLQVVLPPELETALRTRRVPPSKARRAFAQSVVESPDQAISD